MKLYNVDCHVDVYHILANLDFHGAIKKVDVSDLECNPDNIDDYLDNVYDKVIDVLKDSSNYEDTTIEIDGDVDLYYSDIQSIDDDDLIMAVEQSGYTVLHPSDLGEDTRRMPSQTLHEELCEQFDMSRFTSKQDLIKHIHSLL